jgi:polysaccharide export outer membrane protein
MKARGGILSVLLASLLAGCTTTLPASGPDHHTIANGAAGSLLTDPGAVSFNYVLLDINKAVLEHVVHIGPGSFFKSFGLRIQPAPVIRVGVGDHVQVTVFESSSGGLFVPEGAGMRPGNYVTLPTQEVDRSGNITIPFAGQIAAAGRTLPEIQREIEKRIANRAIEPQVLVTLPERNASEVTVVGDILATANRFKIRPGGERILDMISKAGGLKHPGYEAFVTLQRGKKKTTVYFPTLVNDPKENIFVAPGDTLYVYREQQKFVAVGALGSSGQTSGLTGQFAFEQEKLSLNEAIAKAGGLLDFRADPRQVFLYRVEHRESLEKMKVDLRRFPADQKLIPTIYRANFRDPSSFFFAQAFPMRHKDIVYVANADAVEVVKFLNFLRSITSTVAGVAEDAVVIGNPGRKFQ